MRDNVNCEEHPSHLSFGIYYLSFYIIYNGLFIGVYILFQKSNKN